MSRLVKKGNKKYQIILELGRDRNGKKIRKKKTVNVTEPEARKIMIKWEAELLDKPNVKDNITLEKHLQEWIDNYSKNIKPLTIESYKQQIENHIAPNLGHIKLKDLDTKTIDDFYDYKLEKGRIDGSGGLSVRSVRYLHSILHKALEAAIEWDRLLINPASKANPPKKKKPKPNFFTKDQIKKLFSIIDDDYYKDFFELTFRTGMRRGQVLGLQWSCIDQINNAIIIKQNLQRIDGEGFVLQDTTKNGKIYSVPITKKIRKILDRVKDRQKQYKNILGKDGYKDDDFIFCNDDGSPKDPDVVTGSFRRYVKKAELKGTLHDLRHSFASIHIQNGTPMKVIQELLGHKSYKTTADIYSHVSTELKEDVMKQMDNFF